MRRPQPARRAFSSGQRALLWAAGVLGALAIISAILLGFLLGAEFDVLAFLIKRYYGNVAYGKAYGVIFALFYLGSGLGITGLAWLRQHFGNYEIGLWVAAAVLVASALLLSLLPAYRYQAGAVA